MNGLEYFNVNDYDVSTQNGAALETKSITCVLFFNNKSQKFIDLKSENFGYI